MNVHYFPNAPRILQVMRTIQTDEHVPKFQFASLNLVQILANPSEKNIRNFYHFQKEYVIQFYKIIYKSFCYLSVVHHYTISVMQLDMIKHLCFTVPAIVLE